MNREEFLRQFCEALEGKVPEQVINENVRYYRNYINNQVANGKSEQEVLRELGEPRLLAKTIEESSRFAGGREEDVRNGSSHRNTQYYTSGQERYTDTGQYAKERTAKIPGWLAALILLIVAAFLITAVFKVFVFFLPFIVIGVVVTLAYRIIKSLFE